MTKVREIYYCSICGNLIEILSEGAPALVCCDQPMELVEAKTEDATTEKHVPYVQAIGNDTKVTIGENAAHPMTDEHFIKFIEIRTADKVGRAELKPGDDPEAIFHIKKDEIIEAYEYCNVHGLWKD
ncbi:MAG: desulfoferrodoxin [Kiritimatiellae bacterium]|jgi:superoxide reductase|nr:desulfoferrodoxin [Kiritimatiellia bacterium]